MDFKKNGVLASAGIVTLVITIGLTFFLFQFKGQHASVKSELDRSDTQLKRLVNRPHFPSQNNVELVNQNHDKITEFFGTLMEDFSSGQHEVLTMEPAQFGAFLENTTKDLREQTAKKNIKIPEGFAFGFDIFERGALPEVGEIARLQRQVFIVSDLVKLLVEHGVKEIVAVERTKFDQAEEIIVPEPVRRRPGRGPAPEAEEKPSDGYESELYFKEPLSVTFKARESGVWNVLDALASSKLFTIVEGVELVNDAQDVPYQDRIAPVYEAIMRWKHPPKVQVHGLVEEAPELPAVSEDPPSRDQRIVAGREMVIIKLDLSVIYFKQAEKEEASEEEGS